MSHAFRQLLKSPGFTLVAALTLALGIGANTAIFSVINGVLLRPLPFPEPDRLMTIWEASQKQNFPKAPLPPGPYFDLRAQTASFAALAAWVLNPLNLAGDDLEPERIEGAAVTAEFLAVLQITPARGRFFATEEFAPGQDGTVVLSHTLWQQRFGGDPNVLGRQLQLNGRTRTVVGIMPEGFRFPGKTQAWIPYAPDAEFKQRRDWHLLRTFGRLKAGVTYEQARAELRKFDRQFAAQYADTDADWTFDTFPMLEDAVSNIRPALELLVVAVGALLLIACANVANLLLARAAGRQSEIAVRLSLGATRGHIVRQLLAETLLLFALGGTAGVVLAQWGLDALLGLAPANVPRVDQITIDRMALMVTSGVTLVAGLLFGLVPAWQASRTDVRDAMRCGERGATARRSSLRSLFVILQVTAAVALLVVAGLLIRSFEHVRQVALGFNPSHVLTFRTDLPSAKFDTAEKSSRYIADLVRTLATVPGVESAGATTAVPLVAGPTYIMRFQGRPPVTPSNSPVASQRVVTDDYFKTIGATLVRGRLFGPQDIPGSPRVCVINQTLAQKFFPNQDPIGQRLEIGFEEPPAWREIVGIVADMKSTGLDAATPVQVFEPAHQWHINSYSVVVRTTGDPAALAPAIRAAVQKFDRTQPVHTLKPMKQLVSESLAQRTFSLVLLSAFAVVALTLAVIGLYGVIAYGVAQRTREFGVRIALGASARDIVQLVLGEGVKLIGLGLALGIFAALALGSFVRSLLFGVEAQDPGTFLAITALLAIVALAACIVPALRATRVDPARALRAE